jgi:hypothetical protein
VGGQAKIIGTDRRLPSTVYGLCLDQKAVQRANLGYVDRRILVVEPWRPFSCVWCSQRPMRDR